MNDHLVKHEKMFSSCKMPSLLMLCFMQKDVNSSIKDPSVIDAPG